MMYFGNNPEYDFWVELSKFSNATSIHIIWEGSDNTTADAVLCDSVKEVLEFWKISVTGIVEACTELTLYACFGASFVFV